MKITAKKFATSPLEAYRRADKGEEVIIDHARYPDREFNLTATDKLQQESSSTHQEAEPPPSE